jgi:hypothetical protein
MQNIYYRGLPTDLDLNGPILSYTSQPSNATGNKSASAAFTVAATVSFPGDPGAEDGGTITYQWYEVNVGVLSNSTKFSGVTSPTLTVSNLQTPADQGRRFYCEVSYSPNNEYGTPESGTGNAINQPLKSNEAELSVNPELEIIAQPSNRTVAENATATFSINAGLTDDSYLINGPVTYQWYVNGSAVSDGTVRTQNTTESTTTEIIDNIVYDVSVISDSRSFSSDSSISLPATSYNVVVTIAGAAGGGGGSDSGGPGGGGGDARVGRFNYPNGGRTLTFRIGRRGGGGGSGNFWAFGGSGGSNIAPGGRGGGAGGSGWSGGGGGGGGASGVLEGGFLHIVAAGGGGGGGGSWNVGGFGGNTFSPGVSGTPYFFAATTSTINTSSGGTGGDKGGDGGGGGGGGGGAFGGGGGYAGQDNGYSSAGGQSGQSRYRSDVVSLNSQWQNNGDGYGSISYNYTVTTQRVVPTEVTKVISVVIYQNTTYAGSRTPTFTIRSDESSFDSVKEVYCVVSHPTATNKPVTSDTVYFTVVDNAVQSIVNVETIGTTNTATVSTENLSNGDLTFVTTSGDVGSGRVTNQYVLYSPDRDINVEMDLYGGKGVNQAFPGGEGGYSRIRFTMERNVEYVITGLTPSVNTPFVYRKGRLIACVGQGGAGGNTGGRGGDGGGIGVAGGNGAGRTGGQGGIAYAAGTLPANGIWGDLQGAYAYTVVPPDTRITNGNTGGRTIPCARGIYWRNQGLSACSDIAGSTKFRLSDGTEVTNTALIARGFKAGYNIMNNGAGGAVSGGGSVNGGNGATGGGTNGSGGGGGGGGSGYTDGSVTVVSTQRGGSTENAKVVLRVVS